MTDFLSFIRTNVKPVQHIDTRGSAIATLLVKAGSFFFSLFLSITYTFRTSRPYALVAKQRLRGPASDNLPSRGEKSGEQRRTADSRPFTLAYKFARLSISFPRIQHLPYGPLPPSSIVADRRFYPAFYLYLHVINRPTPTRNNWRLKLSHYVSLSYSLLLNSIRSDTWRERVYE